LCIVVTDASVDHVEACILTNRYVATNGIAYQIVIFNGFVVLIIPEHPGFRNMPAKWVPKHVSMDRRSAGKLCKAHVQFACVAGIIMSQYQFKCHREV
jgi:hypothetical protein